MFPGSSVSTRAKFPAAPVESVHMDHIQCNVFLITYILEYFTLGLVLMLHNLNVIIGRIP